MGAAIEKELTDAGYRMLGIGQSKDELILSILGTENTRYLKAIPFLIYNYDTDIERIYEKTTKKKIFAQIIAFTKKIFEENKIDKRLPHFSDTGNLSYEEFKQEFELQKTSLEKPNLMIEKQKIYAERDLEMDLSRIFTRKEKQTMRRIMEEKPVSRTDYEYYSRKAKKKLNSIINLQDFARALRNKNPKYDEDLFNLKKSLEKWLKGKWKMDGLIEEFHISHDRIIINFRSNDGEASVEIFKLNKIKNQEILNLLNKYQEHDYT